MTGRTDLLMVSILCCSVHFSVKEENRIKKLTAYVILVLTPGGHKDMSSLQTGENESSKYWLSVLNDVKNRGVKDIMVICTDGLTGIKAFAADLSDTK